MWSSRLPPIAVLGLLLFQEPAYADKAAADVAFNEAKKLMSAGKIADACPKFELSHKEDPQLGTLLNLADCHEQIGKLATAWAEFREAIDLAKNRNDDREAFARERSEKLAKRVSRVVLVERRKAAGFLVSLDGRDVTALVGVAIPVDPGNHVIVTRVSGGPETTTTVRVDRDGMRIEIEVPLEAEVEALIGAPPRRGRTREIAGLATAGAGVVVASVGLYFGKRAFDGYDESRAFCDDKNRCDPRGAHLIDDANSSAFKSNMLVGVGVGALAVGAVLWLTAPKERNSAVVARPVLGPAQAMSTIELRF